MAEALCGPSNALQTFQKHASVDRSLQQDRLAFRQSPSQNFRSSPAAGASHIDAEFHAFQAGRPLLRDQLPFNTRQFTPPVQAPQHALPGWASDFQQLRLSDVKPVVPSEVRFQPVSSRPGAAGGWQDEFLRHQQTIAAPRMEVSQPFSQSMWQQSMPAFSSSLANSSLYNPPQQQQQNVPAISQEPQFDEAAFAKAFEDVQSQIDESDSKGKEREPVVKFDLSHASMEMGDVTGSYDYDGGSVPLETELLSMRREVGWEALDAYQRAHDLEYRSTGNQESLNVSNTIKQLRTEEERSSQSHTPEPQTEQAEAVRIGADTIPATQQEAEPASSEAEADELAKTAGQLIESLKDEQSTKFQQSSFMELMRQLRDKEVRVDGDNMVAVSSLESESDVSGGGSAVKQAPHPGGRYYPSDAFMGE